MTFVSQRALHNLLYVAIVFGTATERVAFAECTSLADQIRTLSNLKSDLPPSLHQLQKAVISLDKGEESHALSIKNKKGYLKIGYFERGDFTFLKSMVGAVREGSVRDIDIGSVIGPAVVPMLPHLVRITPVGQPIRIYGTLSPKFLIQKVAREGKPAEVERLKSSLREIGALDGCLKIRKTSKLEDCGWMTYEVDTAKNRQFKWSPETDPNAALPPSLATLQGTMKHQTTAAHTLRIKDGRGYLSIGYLDRREDTRFMAAMAQALRDGRIAEIDVGLILGGKVLDLVSKLTDLAPGKTEITGTVRVRLVEKDVRDNPFKKGISTEDRADLYSDIEVQRYEAAVARLKLKEACLKFRGTTDLLKCDELKFRIDTSRPDDIQWEAD